MQYENHRFDERQNPNIPHEPPSREIGRMLLWSAGLLAALWLLLQAVIHLLPGFISIEQEQRWFSPLIAAVREDAQPDPELQTLANQLADRMQLPAGSVQVSISPSSTRNAFATLGGEVVLMQGLLDCLPSEEAVAAVLAHEIAHVAHRDPLRSASYSLLFNLVSSAIFGNNFGINHIQYLESMRYSRQREEAADDAAVHALAGHYRDVGGMVQLMERFETLSTHGAGLPTWMQSHPQPASRLTAAKHTAQRMRYAASSPSRPNRWRSDKSSESCE